MKEISFYETSFWVYNEYHPVFWECVQRAEWEVETFDALKKYLFAGAIFIDIGCWEGPFSLYAAKMGAKCHAIDADEVALSHFQKHLTLNESLAPQIKSYHLALAAQNGVLKLYARNRFGDSAASLLDRIRDVNEFKEVKSQLFSDFCTENHLTHIDFIKMDIEGSEFFILEKMLPCLAKCHFPTLYLAFHPQYLVEFYLKQHIKNQFGGKIILKLCKMLGISLFKKKIKQQYFTIFQHFMQHYEMQNTEGEILNWQLWIESGNCLIPDNILLVHKK